MPLELRVEAEPTQSEASNVVAMLRGADPTLRDEWVVLTAHYDHLGMGPAGEEQDNIYNGADDNASGTAAVLEIARRLASGLPPGRSVLVLLVSGEERGLLGSAYYAQQPLVPMDKVVVDINVDMVGRSQGTVQGIAETSASLHEVAVAIGAHHDILVQPDQHPSWRLAYLSDDYRFTRNDVPAIEFFTGIHEDYHQPTDEVSRIRYDELDRILEAMSELARHYADGAPRPTYHRPAWFLTPE